MDLFKVIASALTGIAGLLVFILPNHTIGYHIAQGVVGLGAAGGILSPGTSQANANLQSASAVAGVKL